MIPTDRLIYNDATAFFVACICFSCSLFKQEDKFYQNSRPTVPLFTNTPYSIMGNNHSSSPSDDRIPQDVHPYVKSAGTCTVNNATVIPIAQTSKPWKDAFKTEDHADAFASAYVLASDVPDLTSVISTLVEENWLDAKDVGRYDMTNKTASVDPRLWKVLFRQKQGRHPHCMWCRPKSKGSKVGDSDHEKEKFLQELFFWPIAAISFVSALLVTTHCPPYCHVDNMTKFGYNVWLSLNVLIWHRLCELVLGALLRQACMKVEWSGFGV